MCPPLSWRENKWKDSRERWLWIAPIPARLEDAGISLRLDWVKMSCDRERGFCGRIFEVSSWPLSLFLPLGGTIQSKDSLVFTSSGFTRPLVAAAQKWAKRPWNPISGDSGWILDLRQSLVASCTNAGLDSHVGRFLLIENCFWRPIYRMLGHIITNV